MMHVFWNIVWYTLTIICVIIGIIVAMGRVDDWKDPNHKIGRPYKKTYFNE